MTGSDRATLAAHKRLYEAGSAAVPLLERELGRVDLTKVARREAMSAVVGLTALLHDIDEAASNAFIGKALQSNRHVALIAALRGIQRYSISNFHRSSFDGVPIFEEAVLDARYKATAHVQEWLRSVPPADLAGISRIYIVKTKPDFDFLGTYLQTLSVVTLVWDTRFAPGGVLSWLLQQGYKHTLYHEIGHHAHKHREFGQDPQQEAEAESYARKLLAKTNPISLIFGRLLGRMWK